MISFSLPQPDDFHVHLRDEELLKSVAPYTASQFARATIMPNLRPPVTTTAQAEAYQQRIKAAASGLKALMTLYLTDHTSAAEIERAAKSGIVKGLKLYPAGATTNSDSGVTDIQNIYPALEAAEKHGLLFLVHGEVTDKEVDIFDREAVFIERILAPLTKKFPGLKIVLEHVTTRQGVDFVNSSGKNIAATLTPQHLLCNRNDMLVGGLHPHYYCLPVLKREEHRQALVHAALNNTGKFFAGTDSAPHLQHDKESSCGCAGCFTATSAIELYAESFDREADLSQPRTQGKFADFMSRFGADFYSLPRNEKMITLTKKSHKIPDYVDTARGKLIPFLAGAELAWRIEK